MDWIVENKDWIFNGIGILAITGIAGLFFKKAKHKNTQQSIKSGKNSTNIQNSRDVKVRNGQVDDEK